MEQFKNFLWTWGSVLIANQLFLFGGCFKPYCIAAAIPHTLALTAFLFFGFRKLEQMDKK